MGDTGLEPDSLSSYNFNNLQIHGNQGGAESGAVAGATKYSRDFEFVTAKWPFLSDAAKEAVIAVVRASIPV